MIAKEPLFSKFEPYLVPAIVVLVGLAAFGLGRLSAAPGHQALRILYPEAALATPVAAGQDVSIGEGSAKPAPASGNFVASKNGSKYYLTTCSGAKRIKEENKVYFATALDARAAGYEPAIGCPGL